MTNIILCGLPMSGKTTLGKMVAEKLRWDFIDTDRLIENAYALNSDKRCTCRQILMDEGELRFRELEKQQIASLKHSRRNIIALGGGTLYDRENTQMLKLTGTLIYLKAPPSRLWERIRWRGIPAYLDQNNPEKAFYDMLKKRIPLYEEAANFIIETGHLSEQEIVAAILNIRKM